jgi:hypothetical protein
MTNMNHKQKESGMVAIMVTLILMIVISLIVLGFAQISRRNQRQALDSQLSTQAFYAAESGVNEVAYLMQSKLAQGVSVPAKSECRSDSDGFYASLKYAIDEDNAVEYTCLTVDPTPSELKSKNVDTTGTIFPLVAANGASIDSIALTWKTLDSNSGGGVDPSEGCRPNLTDPPFLTSDAWTQSKCGYGVLRMDLVPTSGLLGMQSLRNNTMTTFFVPLTSTNAPSGAVAYAAGGGNAVVGVRCTSESCTQTINGLSGNRYYLRVSSIYKSVSFEVAAKDASSIPLEMQDAQAVVDVTGKAQDVLRRIQVRIPLSGSSTNLLSDYAIQSTESLCKRFSVMNNYYRYVPPGAVSGVESTTTNPLCQSYTSSGN